MYLRVCEYLIDESKYTECEKIGLEAISLLNEELIIRGKVADLTAKAAKELGHTKIVWKCYKAATLIFALGETMELNGNYGAEMDLIEHYKKIHSRKRAFKEEFEILK